MKLRKGLPVLPVLLLTGVVCAGEDIPDDVFTGIEDIPVVLTATRLKQPRSEVPASVTVIEAEQIRAWGLRTIPEVLRFVPGMTLGHSQSESTDTVVYHASTQNFMRRMQVLVDGRSVYKAAIAKVTWDDIPVALDDIQRIEVTRGPSSATYGANAFMAVINIITKAPEDTLGTRLSYQRGNQSVEDGFASYAAMSGEGSYRISAGYTADDGFDGRDTTSDQWDDDIRNRFVSLTYQQPLSARSQLALRAAFNNSYADIGTKTEPAYQFRDTDSGFVQGRLEWDFSNRHQSYLQVYWQRENRGQEQSDCVPTVALDPGLFELYRLNPAGTLALLESLKPGNGPVNTSVLQSADEQALFQSVMSRAGFPDMTNLAEITCGVTYSDVSDQRVDIEWQDTVVWSDTLRTVSGLNFRRDEARSRALFNGRRENNLYRVFANVEWRLHPALLLNAGAMYEREDLNDPAFSPRLALNWLWSDQQSVRLVWSQAVRSPDMLEQEPEWTLTSDNLDPSANYLGLSSGRFFMSHIADYRGLDQERITSYELGYYHALPAWHVELDVKLYHDELRDLISDAISIENTEVDSDTRIDIQGAEMQLQWRPRPDDWLWLTLAYTDVDTVRDVEARLSPERSAVASWHHRQGSWSSTLSYFWLDSLNNGNNLYHRSEVNLRKHWQSGRYRPWLGVFWQHQFERVALGHYTQMYATSNLYYLQAGLEF